VLEKMGITELSRETGASVDEIRYMERKGFISPRRTKLGERQVRQYRDGDIRKVRIIVKYRRQGLVWDAAHQRALEELVKPSLF